MDPLSEAAQRHHVFDAVSRVLAAQHQPILLVADDAHWCDEQSLQLLHYLLRLPGDQPFLAVATARREEMDRSGALGALVDGLQTLDRLTEIRLDRLTRAASEQLIAVLAEERATPPIDQLYDDSEGNPLFIVELMRALATGGRRRHRSADAQAPGRHRTAAAPALRRGARADRAGRDRRPRDQCGHPRWRVSPRRDIAGASPRRALAARHPVRAAAPTPTTSPTGRSATLPTTP